MEEYIETKLVECDRLNSDPSDDSNTATWKNSFTDSIQLEAGDRVSVYSTFISERGASQPNSIEFKGKSIGTKTIKYTKTVNEDITVSQPLLNIENLTIPHHTIHSEVEETIPIYDNKFSIVINYYKTLDTLSYVQLPRRFIPDTSLFDPSDVKEWGMNDSTVFGRVNREPYETGVKVQDVYGYVVEDYKPIYIGQDDNADVDRLTWAVPVDHWVLKNDNSKFTTLVRTRNFHYPKQFIYPSKDAVAHVEMPYMTVGQDGYLSNYFLRDPEASEYIMLRQKIDLEVPKGFSSAQFVSEEITKTFRDALPNPTNTMEHGWGKYVRPDDPNLQYDMSKSIESQTYKKFPSVNDAMYNADSYQYSMGALANISLIDIGGYLFMNNEIQFESSRYYEGLEYISVKRPELYVSGCKFNDIFGYELLNVGNDEADFKKEGILLDLDYTQENCDKLKALIEAQGKHPELFMQKNIVNMIQDTGTETTNPYYERTSVNTGDPALPTKVETFNLNVTINNARFLHMNIAESVKTNDTIDTDAAHINSYQYGKLGCSYYDVIGTTAGNPNRTLTEELISKPFYFKYDPSQKETFYDAPSLYNEDLTGQIENKLTYGCIGYSGVGGKICIFPNKLTKQDGTSCGIPSHFFIGGDLEQHRKVGFDRHWNAWSTAAVALTTGIPTKSRFPDQFAQGEMGSQIAQYRQAKSSFNTEEAQTNINVFLNYTYLGAPTAKLGFDGSHFYFSDLHNGLNQGDLDNSPAGETSQDTSIQIVYKINPPQKYNNYSPVQFPYQAAFEVTYKNSATTAGFATRLNPNIQPYAIYDTTTGIFIEDLGVDEKNWSQCFWGRLGFTYDQLHSTVQDRLSRHPNQPDKINYLTTNSLIDTVDSKGWNQNQFFNPLFDGTLAHTKTIYFDTDGGISRYTMFPEIATKTESIKILAKEYPIQNFKGYYTIRSDIVSDAHMVGGKTGDTNLAIVGVIDKMNPAGDFYFGTESSIKFTITKPTILSSVSVAITDSDGSYSVVSERSSVIFKIESSRTLNKNVLLDIQKKFKESA